MNNQRSKWRSRWSFRVTLSRPSGLAEGFWPQERRKFLLVFKPYAERYRRRKRVGIALFMGSLLGGIAFTFLGVLDVTGPLGIVLFFAGLVVSCLVLVVGRKLVCPACKKRLEPARGLYCPQCGSDQFEYGSHSSCPSCNSKITEEDADSARSYRIRGCTHCGAMLDEEGL